MNLLYNVDMSLIVALEVFFLYSYVLSFPSIRLWEEAAMSSEIPRPFVYRALVPIFSQVLEVNSVPIVAGFAVGFFFASSYLYKSLGVRNHTFYAFLSCQVLFLATLYQIKYYDYATAFFFALLLALMVNNKHGVFMAVFALATLNRETTFLLIGFYAVWFWGKMPVHKYFTNILILSVIFVSIRLVTQLVFSQSPGTDVWYTLPENLRVYTQYWYVSLPMFTVIIGCFIGGLSASEFVRKFVLVVFIPQVILFILSGKPFETRVFAESIAILPLLSLSAALSLIQRKGSLFRRPLDTSA